MFLPILVTLYLLTPERFRNVLLLIASIFFYSWGAPKFIFVILGTTLVDYVLVRLIHSAENIRLRTALLILSLCVNLGLLFYFKYSNFFIDNINALLGFAGLTGITWTKLVLPIGISFYTFESLTYVIDVYRRTHAPLKNFWEYQLYIILFPKLIAGPIIRYHDIADQIRGRFADENIQLRINGFFRFSIGLSKKILIANVLGQVADTAYSVAPENLNTTVASIAAICYTFQIYFDFSGYSDMAIGLGMLFGFRFPENFNNPYISQSITEFWRRWHISLGAWMKNYLYIPLGGNKVESKLRLYFNLWFVFLASGLWHGASWNFIFWGAYHGFFLVLERSFLLNIYQRVGRVASIILCFIIVNIGWVYFRLEGFSTANSYVANLFSFDFGNLPFRLDYKAQVILLLAFVLVFIWSGDRMQKIQERILSSVTDTSLVIKCLTCILLLIICSGYIIASDFNPFIYFRF